MEDALPRIAALGPSLKEGEFRCLVALASRAAEDPIARLSSRELARIAGLERRNVQLALNALTERGLIACDGGSATRAAEYRLLFLETAVLSTPEVPLGRGVVATPPPPTQVALFQRQGGVVPTPGGGVVVTPPHKENARAPAHGSESDLDLKTKTDPMTDLLERIAKANPKRYDSDELVFVRDLLWGHWKKLRNEPDAHPPDDKICAELLAIATKRQIHRLLDQLWRERKVPDRSYRWFVTVALQRICHIAPTASSKALTDLRIIERHVPRPEQQELLSSDEKEQLVGIHEAFEKMKAGKAFR